MALTILKIPFDLGIIDKERRGASLAPDLLTKNLKGSKIINVPVYEDFSATHESIHSAAISALKKGRVVAVGGDHSITFSLATAFKQIYPNSCLIIFDAHSDCEDDFIPPSHEGVTRALASTCFAPNEILLIGYRKARTQEEKEFIRKHKIEYIDSKDINEQTIAKVSKFLSKFNAAYLSLDIDIFDSKDAPGTGWPEPNGPAKKLLIKLLKDLGESEKLKSLDLVETSPPLDRESVTVTLASDLLKIFATPKG